MTRRNFIKSGALWVPMIGALTLAERADATVSYFGANATSSDFIDIAGQSRHSYQAFSGNTMACPGSGSQPVGELGAYVKAAGGGGSVRMAIYGTDGTFLMQWSSAVSVAAWAAESWVSSTSFVDAAGSPIASPVLTGGTSYWLAITASGSSLLVCYLDWTYENNYYKAADYTAGFPSPIGTGWSGLNEGLSMRCGVSSAGTTRKRMPIVT